MEINSNNKKSILRVAKILLISASIILLYSISFSNGDSLVHFIIYLFYFIGASIYVFLHLENIIFDPQDYKPNTKKNDIVFKLRLRALLFNNLSVIIFCFIFVLIVISFYYLLSPLKDKNTSATVAGITLTAVTTSLIFLVQIAFRVFKYILRVAAFYNARADAIEFSLLDASVTLKDLMELFTPSTYDISDVTNDQQAQGTISGNVLNAKPQFQATASSTTGLLLKRGEELPSSVADLLKK
ncbi:hypothetical protein [Spirosoma foliorum]|uniref:Uncharacterized protein n=1 Tax=Spirosoma foliorum TaxID=2710596 RepID=A0A7G5GS60_9BACT|nr:hypothetical protein [Spirosoma foliorum]QMW01702.1 hypothetical protein H3H32_27690 [Spirosoma foliorum]